jgi:hypothetical protein
VGSENNNPCDDIPISFASLLRATIHPSLLDNPAFPR